MSRPATPIAERFWALVDVGDGCWEWMGHRNILRGGYGTFIDSRKSGKRMWRAHRLAYELHYGPFDPDLLVLHECDNPPCVNPAHLKLGTQKENLAEMVERGRHKGAAMTHCAQGHELTPDNVYKGKTPATRRCRECHRINGAQMYRNRQARLAAAS
jgi:hypothetical protein